MAGIDWSGEPAYRQLAADLRRRIDEEGLEPGTQLPSSADLRTEYGVSITVVRLALGLLKAEGRVRVAPGKGNFVADGNGHRTEEFDEVMRQLDAMRQCIEDLGARMNVMEQQAGIQPPPAAGQGPPNGKPDQR